MTADGAAITDGRPPRVPRPNYARLHAKPLPVDTFPLPPLIPHNPLSLLQIAIVYLSHLLAPPSSHSKQGIKGFWSPETRSVHVTDNASIRLLWERGFFGKGTLSRSEPSWLDREKKKLGLLATDTSEEYTKQRREERKRFKEERARKEREAIEQILFEEKLEAIGAADGNPTARSRHEDSIGTKMHGSATDPALLHLPPETSTEPPIMASESESFSTLYSTFSIDTSLTIPYEKSASTATAIEVEPPKAEVEIQNQEHLQLTLEEAFFLTFALGVLEIYPATPIQDQSYLSTEQLLPLFRSHSYFPPAPSTSLTPADPFLLSYAAYHHYRSLGWVIRPGMKFAVDWLLYIRGPVFSHAEFAVIVQPAYRDPWWQETEERRRVSKAAQKRSWDWLHCLQRVQANVKKSLIIAWVEIPGGEVVEKALGGVGQEVDVVALLKLYKIRDMTVKRWIPNRSRD